MDFHSSGAWSTSIGSISVPTADSKGFLVNTNYDYGWANGVCLFIYPGIDESKYVGYLIRKIIEELNKVFENSKRVEVEGANKVVNMM